MSLWSACKIWENGTCFILGGGHSVIEQLAIPGEVFEKVRNGQLSKTSLSSYMQALHDQHVIGINSAYQIGNWIDVCFFGDMSFYAVNRKTLSKYQGLKVSCSEKIPLKCRRLENIKVIQKDWLKPTGITTNPNMISWNRNSGAAAINLAVHFGVKKIVLLGFDMDLSKGGEYSHWFGYYSKHKVQFAEAVFRRQLIGFPQIAEDAKKLGVEIINANPKSKIDCFPKMNLKDILCKL